MEFAGAIGAIGVVVHVPHLRTKRDLYTKSACLRNFIRNVRHLIAVHPDPWIVIETVHTSKDKLGGTIAEIAAFWKKIPIEIRNRIRFCIDTAHIFALGYPIQTADGVDSYFTQWDRLIGLSAICAIHCNDSRVDCGTQLDRHESLGKGFIYGPGPGLEALRRLVEYADRHRWPMFLETPDQHQYKHEIDLLRSLLDYRVLCMERLTEIQQLKEYGNPYENVVQQLAAASPIRSLNDLDTVKLSPTMRQKCIKIIQTGFLRRLTNREKCFLELISVYGIGPKLANQYMKQGMTSIPQLKRHMHQLPHTIQMGLKYYDDLKERVPRAEQEEFAHNFLSGFNYRIAGSYYKGKSTSSDIDILIIGSPQDMARNTIVDRLVSKKHICEQISRTVLFAQAVQGGRVRHIDIRTIESTDQLLFYMFFFTSGKVFNKTIRQIAKEKGYRLSEKGLFHRETGRRVAIHSEKAIFKRLGIDYVPIELR